MLCGRMTTARALRETLIDAARRFGRVTHEAEDLAHDIIVASLRRGVALDGDVFLRNLHGAARRHAAFLARSAGRRRAREARVAREHVQECEEHVGDPRDEGAPLAELSPALRTTLHLLLVGLEKAELLYLLRVSDAALRKRFQALRDHGPLARPALPPTMSAHGEIRRSLVGLVPRVVEALSVGEDRRAFAATDPDGHGILFVEALTPGRGAATSGGGGPPTKGNPC